MKPGKRISGPAKRPRRRAAELALFASLAFCPVLLSAQEAPPRWGVAGGSGFVFRSIRNGSFGVNVRAARIIPVSRGLYLEPGVTWHGYLSSDAWFDQADFMFCLEPELPCLPAPRRDGIGFAGLELGAAYLKPGAANPVHPVAGFGIYRSTARSVRTTRVGATAGLAFPFGRSYRGAAIEARYFRMFNDPRFASLLYLSLRYIF